MTTAVIVNPLAGWLEKCQQQKAVTEDDFWQGLRQKAAAVVAESRLPGKQDEQWRFTELSELLSLPWQIAPPLYVTQEAIIPFGLPEAPQSRLVFVNGAYAPNLSDVSALPPQVWVGNAAGLADAQKEMLVKYLGRQPGQEEVFASLNGAGLTDVAIVWIQSEQVIETPIHLLFLTVVSEIPTLSQPRILVVAERGAKGQIVESYGAISNNCTDIPQNYPYLTNAVSEIYLEENAHLEHIRVQRESGDGFQIARSAIAQKSHSRYTYVEVSLGAKLSRHNLDIYQQGEQTETHLHGLAMIEGKQVADTHSAVYLHHPHGTVNQLHKCIVDGQAHAIFNGKIVVPKPAQLTNAAQLNRNLLLSAKASVNTKPELQITADNVKCSHGATVSQLEADELFYLRSRGLSEDNARNLLIDAFAAEILDKIPLVSLRQRLSHCVACRTNI